MIFAFILFSFLICGAHNPSQSFYRPVNRPLRLLTADIDTRYKISKKKAMYVIKSKKKNSFPVCLVTGLLFKICIRNVIKK